MAFVTIGKERVVDDEDQFILVHEYDSDFAVCKSPEKLKKVLDSLVEGKLIEFVTRGDWSLIDMVMELLKKYRPAEIYIATYAIREFPIRQLVLAQERGDLTQINLLLEYRAKVRTPEVYHLAALNANRVFLTPIHAKATVIKSPVGCVTITGSQNYTANPRLENGFISVGDKRAQANIDWIEKTINNAEIFD